MITIDAQKWGTAAEIAQALGLDVTEDMIRNWARRDGLPKARLVDDDGRPQVRYPLAQAAAIEARKRLSPRGRPRKLDDGMITAA